MDIVSSGISISAAFILVAVFLVFSVGIAAAIGCFVYQDSKKRGMNAALWTLVVLIAPGFIGLIIYLVVRSDRDSKNIYCSSCGNAVDGSFNICPYCSAVLKPQCPRCSYPISAGWYVCPSCGEELPDEVRAHTTEQGGSDRGLSAILIGVVVVPIGLIVLAVVACFAIFTGEVNVSYGELYEESVSLSPDLPIYTEDVFDAKIDVHTDIKSIYSVDVTFYGADGNAIETAGVSNADGSNLSDIYITANIQPDAVSCIISFYGKSGELLCESESIELDGGAFIEGCLSMNGGQIEFEY